MTDVTRAIIIERKLPHSPEKIWRALTEAALIEDWLMKNDFVAEHGARFTFQAKPMGDWDGLVHCAITVFEPPRRLAYTWQGGAASNRAYGSALDTLVEWTLTPEPDGTRVRMIHSGFRPENAPAHDAMSGGWAQVLERLDRICAQLVTPATRSVVVEREFPHPPAKLWRALTQAPLIEEWLALNDFAPVVGHRFQLRSTPSPHWNGITDCEVLVVEPLQRLVYSWNASGEEAATGPRTIVAFTLTPTRTGTQLRMEHSGFGPEHENNYRGAGQGWQKFFAALERVVAGIT